jgi:hypothetical protein
LAIPPGQRLVAFDLLELDGEDLRRLRSALGLALAVLRPPLVRQRVERGLDPIDRGLPVPARADACSSERLRTAARSVYLRSPISRSSVTQITSPTRDEH